MKIDCSYDKKVKLSELIPNPKNNNRHTPEQIERLAKIIEFQGMRSPVVVSNRSGFVIKGHCRIEALQYLGWDEAPVDYQDYESEAQEYMDMTADNEIARWSQLDLQGVHLEIEALEIEEIELLGMERFTFEKIDEDLSDKNKEIDTDNFGNDLEHQCPKCGFEFNE